MQFTGDSSAVAIPLRVVSGDNEASKTIEGKKKNVWDSLRTRPAADSKMLPSRRKLQFRGNESSRKGRIEKCMHYLETPEIVLEKRKRKAV